MSDVIVSSLSSKKDRRTPVHGSEGASVDAAGLEYGRQFHAVAASGDTGEPVAGLLSRHSHFFVLGVCM